ncbi:hypothetical protein Esti_003072 [Eimeria stiedai]
MTPPRQTLLLLAELVLSWLLLLSSLARTSRPAALCGFALQSNLQNHLLLPRHVVSRTVGSPRSVLLASPSSSFGQTQPLSAPATMMRSLTRLAGVKGPVQTTMEKKLQEALSPSFLEVVNESAAHKGHAGNPSPHLEETHFMLRIRSNKFRGKTLVQQHRLIYEVLRQELREGVHALSIQSGEPDAADSP